VQQPGPQDIRRHRLRAQRLWDPPPDDAAAALRWLLAFQSQEYAYARWSLAQRTGGPARDNAVDVDEAIAAGTILRTHILRPTWHFVHRGDLPWLMLLSQPRLKAGNKGRDRQLGLDAATVARGNDVLAAAVADGRHRTREELAARLTEAGLLPDDGVKLNGAPLRGQRLGHLVFHAEMDRILVSGTPRPAESGAVQQTYASFDERVPALAAGFDRDAALARLTARYFASRGPASVKDCSDWSKLPQADIRRGLEAGGQEGLERTEADGVELWFSPAAGTDGGTPTAGNELPRADLIQCYDEYVMGYSKTRGYLGGSAPAALSSAVPQHVLLLDGKMAGNWKHVLRPGSAELRLKPLRAFSAAERHAVDGAVERYAAFLRRPLTLELA
jgi:hypothetical protein